MPDRFTHLDHVESVLPDRLKKEDHVDPETRDTLLRHYAGPLANVSTVQETYEKKQPASFWTLILKYTVVALVRRLSVLSTSKLCDHILSNSLIPPL